MAVNLVNSNDIEVTQTGDNIQLNTTVSIQTLESDIETNTTNISTNATDITNLQTYSTDEVNIGKIWIDGKPIYRKVIEYGTLTNSAGGVKNHNIINIDKIIHLEVFANNSEGMTYSLPHVAAPNMGGSMTMAMRADKTNVYVYCSSNMTSYTAYFILEYTKTTD